MDYDTTSIPAGYDRGRSLNSETLDAWMDAIARSLPFRPNIILDLGCGTGRFSDALAVRFSATVIGMDPSAKMLEQARPKQVRGTVRWVRATGEALPLRDAAVDVVFTSMTYHHFSDPRRVAEECRRAGRRNAVVIVRAGTRNRIDEYPYVPFIPATRRILHERLPSLTEIQTTFEAAGFTLRSAEILVQQAAPTYLRYAERLKAGGDSVLASLAPGVLDEGLRAIRDYADRIDPCPVTEPIDLLVFRLP